MRLAALEARRGAPDDDAVERRCSPTCAAAPGGRRSSTPRARHGSDGVEPRADRARRRRHATSTAAARRAELEGARAAERWDADVAVRRRRLRRRQRAPPTRWWRCPTAGAAGRWRESLGEARARGRAGPGPQLHGGAAPPVGGPPRRLGAHAADDVRRARLPRARRLVVRARRRAGRRRWPTAGPSAGRWRPRWRRWPAAWPTSTVGPSGWCSRREDVVRYGPKRPPIAAGVRRRRVGRAAGGPHPGLARP